MKILDLIDEAIELGWRFNPLEARNARGEWTKSGEGYIAPDHARLFNPRSRKYKDPADHPFFKNNPVTAASIIKTYDAATPQEKAQGMRWYADAHEVAADIADGNAEKGAAVLAAYSPQTSWPVNMMNAARAIKENRALGPGDGMITGSMQRVAQKALDGTPIDLAFPSPKTNAFAHLIAAGGDTADNRLGHVVIDRHALSVAVGRRIFKNEADEAPIDQQRFYEHIADQYRLAALEVSRRGEPVSPHQMQAITWLHQQAANEAADAAGGVGAGGKGLGKGRIAATANAWQHWNAWASTHGVDTEKGTTALSGSIAGQVLGLAAWEHELRDAHGRWTRSVVNNPITAAEARGDSRPVSHGEYQRLANEGLQQLSETSRHRAPITGLDQHWSEIKAKTYVEVQQPWGGATIDAHTGEALATDADKYALTVKPEGMHTVSVPETSSEHDFNAAMDMALARFRPELEKGQRHLGIFHDDDNHRIDIDPVLVVDSLGEVERIGAYTHAIGGAYHFRSGDGFWPPHVAEGIQMSNQGRPHFAGPGQWRSAAAQVQPGLSEHQQAEIERGTPGEDSGDDDPEPPESVAGQVLSFGWHDAWRHEMRGPHGEWVKGAASDAKLDADVKRINKSIQEYRDSNKSMPTVARYHLLAAIRFSNSGDLVKATHSLAEASKFARSEGYPGSAADIKQFQGFARRLQGAMNRAYFRAEDNLGEGDTNGELVATVTDLAAEAAPLVLKALGAKKQEWDGEIGIQDELENPYILAEIDWYGHMTMRSDVAKSISTALSMKNEPVADPASFSVLIHELIHGAGDGKRKRSLDKAAYQDPAVASIEEGSTELGTVMHAPEIFDGLGVGDRETFILSDKENTGAQKDLADSLRAEWHSLMMDTKTRVMQVPDKVDNAILAVENGDWETVQRAIRVIQHLGDPERYKESRMLQSKLDKIISGQHATMSEYARRLQDPKRVDEGDAWGHYSGETAAMQEWVHEIAKVEGYKENELGPGGRGWPRVVELADEINRQGAAGKAGAMAAQLVRAFGDKPSGDAEDQSYHMYRLEERIKEGFAGIGRPDGIAAFRNAAKAHTEMMRGSK